VVKGYREDFLILPNKELNKNNETDFSYNTPNQQPKGSVVSLTRIKATFELVEIPVVVSCRSVYSWKSGKLVPLGFNPQEEPDKIRNYFESNPWKTFFAFNNALLRDFYHENASIADDNRDLEVIEEYDITIYPQPFTTRRLFR
jgi:hypothetical protein